MIIAKQSNYSKEHEELIDLIHQEISATFPIIIIPVNEMDERFIGDDNKFIYSFFHEDEKLIELVNKLKNNWQKPYDWLGAETKQDQSLLSKRLENAYYQHYFDDGILGVPDYNHMIVAEALRIKSTPSSHLKAEFDDTVKNLSFFDLPDESSDYQQEIKKILHMTDGEKKLFLTTLMKIRGYEPSGNGWTVANFICGERVNGFAIDPVTLETLITTKHGYHHRANYYLSRRINVIEEIKNREKYYQLIDYQLFERRLITGLIYLKVPNFKTPILQLQAEIDHLENLKTIVPFIKRQKKFIALDCEGVLLV